MFNVKNFKVLSISLLCSILISCDFIDNVLGKEKEKTENSTQSDKQAELEREKTKLDEDRAQLEKDRQALKSQINKQEKSKLPQVKTVYASGGEGRNKNYKQERLGLKIN